MSIKSVMPSSHLILCHPLLLLTPIPPSIRVFSNESTLRMRSPKYWSFSFSISPSKEHPELISFRMDLLYLLAVQGTLKSLLQHHSSNINWTQNPLYCFSFFLFFYFLLKDDCFTEFCCFQSNLNTNVGVCNTHTYTLPLEPPSHLPIPLL